MIKRTIFGRLTVLFIVSLIFTFSSIVYFSLPFIEEKFQKSILKYLLSSYENTLDNALCKIKREENWMEKLLYDADFYKRASDLLEIPVTKYVKNLFLIYEDSGFYRFLIDVSPEDRAERGELFFPTDEERKILERIKKNKREEIIYHPMFHTIGITLIKPVLSEGSIDAFVFLDFSVKFEKKIRNVVKYLGYISLGIMIFSFSIISLLLFLIVRYIFLTKRVYIDPLTGVYNRNIFPELLNFINLSNYAVVLIDIDFFKKINDTYGHKAGDKILHEFATILKKSVRNGEDYIIRYGGEEFLLLLKKGRHSKEKIIEIIERILENIENYQFKVNGNRLKITASAGIFLDTEKAKSFPDAIKKADIVLYKAKREGRNRFEVYTEDNIFLSILEIDELINKGNVICFYQPVVNLKTRKIEYLEALVRLKDNSGKILSPYYFLDIIRGSFVYSKLSREVLKFNLKVLKSHEDVKISINLSPSDFLDEPFMEEILKIDSKNIIDRLSFEIIETEEIQNYSKVLEGLALLKNKGFKIAIDDFGSGFSNFEYLLKLDADYVKIDGNLIKNIVNSERSLNLVKSIVEFCKAENIKVVAEYVENERIFKKISEIGIDYGQGYYFYDPRPIEDLISDCQNKEK